MVERISKITTTGARGRQETWEARKLKSGEVAYYRGGKRVTSKYQVRVAKGVLAGKSYADAQGKSQTPEAIAEREFKRTCRDRLLKKAYIDKNDKYIEKWATSALAGKRNAVHTYYVKVSVQAKEEDFFYEPVAGQTPSLDEIVQCKPATIAIQKVGGKSGRDLVGMTRTEFISKFEDHVMAAVRRARLRLCTGDLKTDLIAVFRHVER